VLDGNKALEELRDKYVTMLAMRIEHDRGGEDEVEARRRMAELAARFPGALRELDDLELDEIRRRVAAIDAVLHGDREKAEPWMEALARFHMLARGALCAKRWLGGRKRVDAQTEAAFAKAIPSLPFPEDSCAWASDLARIAAPPRGRVTDLVFARVAREMGISEKAARQVTFGLRRNKR
jgi:hypothetical protein